MAATRRREPEYGQPPRNREASASHEHTERSTSHSGANNDADRGKTAVPPARRRPASARSTTLTAARPTWRRRRRASAHAASGSNGEIRAETPRAGELVVGLAASLRPEVAGRRRQASDVEVGRAGHASAGGLDGSDELEVLEEDIAVVSVGPAQRAAPHRERAGEVDAAPDPIEERPRGVPARVPHERREVVLRPHQFDVAERSDRPFERERVVAHVVVRDHDPFVTRQRDAGEDAADLPVATGDRVMRPDMASEPRPLHVRGVERRRVGAVDDDQLATSTDLGEVAGELAVDLRRPVSGSASRRWRPPPIRPPKRSGDAVTSRRTTTRRACAARNAPRRRAWLARRT